MSFADLAALTIHDVKNRLAALAGRAEAAGDRETLRSLLESAGLLTSLLTLFKAESSSLALSVEARTPADLLDELAGGAGPASSPMVAVADGEPPLLWYYDETLVRMVLLNALQNALRHARRSVLVGARESGDGEWLEFFVRDDGAGYPPALLADPAAARPVTREGTGLGLQLAGRVAALHENAGRVGEVILANDGGAVFTLRLPR